MLDTGYPVDNNNDMPSTTTSTRPDWLGIVIGVAAPLVFIALLAIVTAAVPS